MATNKLESYLINLDLSYESVDDNSWVISDSEKGLENVVVIVEEPLIIVRVAVMKVPDRGREELFETLLKLNGSDILHGAYALENDTIILIDTLNFDTVDFEEFQATLDAVGLALAQHYPILSKYRKQ